MCEEFPLKSPFAKKFSVFLFVLSKSQYNLLSLSRLSCGMLPLFITFFHRFVYDTNTFDFIFLWKPTIKSHLFFNYSRHILLSSRLFPYNCKLLGSHSTNSLQMNYRASIRDMSGLPGHEKSGWWVDCQVICNRLWVSHQIVKGRVCDSGER